MEKSKQKLVIAQQLWIMSVHKSVLGIITTELYDSRQAAYTTAEIFLTLHEDMRLWKTVYAPAIIYWTFYGPFTVVQMRKFSNFLSWCALVYAHIIRFQWHMNLIRTHIKSSASRKIYGGNFNTGITHFIVLCFIVHHRYCVFLQIEGL